MMSPLSILILAAALGQVPAEPDWLNAVPSDADVVLRVRGLGAVKTDLVAMLKAMSPALAVRAEPAIEQGIALAKTQVSEKVDREPFLLLLRAVQPQEPGSLPFAFVVKSANYEADLKTIAAGKDSEIQHLPAGYDSFRSPGGQTWYASRGTDSLAFGADRILIESFGKAGDKAVGKTITPGLRTKFFAGDLGLIVNINALATRYAEPIAQAEQSFFATFEKLGPQMGTGMVEFFKSFYGGMFDSIKRGDTFALSLDFSGEGFGMAGTLTVQPSPQTMRMIANLPTTDVSSLDKLPGGSAYYAAMNMDSETYKTLQKMSLKMMSPGGQSLPELDAAIAKEHGRIETVGSMSMDNGIKSFQVTNLADPKSFVAAYQATMKLMQASDSPLNVYKEVKTTPNVETYRGFSFTRIDMTIDYDKFAKLQPTNPSAVATAKAMYGGDTMTSWLGAGEAQLIQVMTPSWAEARSQIDGYFTGQNSIGATAGFRATRSKLSQEASVLALMSAQGLVRQVVAQISMINPQASKQPQADLPEEPALIGFSFSPKAPNAFEFQFFAPSAVGPVFEKGLVPAFSSFQPPVKP